MSGWQCGLQELQILLRLTQKRAFLPVSWRKELSEANAVREMLLGNRKAYYGAKSTVDVASV
jgi:hypothetical protein